MSRSCIAIHPPSEKPIEELLPDLLDEETTQAVEQASLDLEPYQDLHNERERWNEMRA